MKKLATFAWRGDPIAFAEPMSERGLALVPVVCYRHSGDGCQFVRELNSNRIPVGFPSDI